MKGKTVAIILFGFAILFLCLSACIMYYSNADAYQRVRTERDLANSYIEYLLNSQDEGTKVKEDIEVTEDAVSDAPVVESTEFISPSYEYEDGEFYQFSPEYAQGEIDCVFEYPALNIKRGVYIGAMEHDLDMWMVVAANDNYILGETHYCIYGHNSLTFEVSLNALLNAKIGQFFTLTDTTGEYKYIVSNITYESRSKVNGKYVNNWNISSDKCYIITCGRYEHRYTDMIVEGTLYDFRSLQEIQNEMMITEAVEEDTESIHPSEMVESKTETEKTLPKTEFKIEYINGTLYVNKVLAGTDELVIGGTVALYDQNDKMIMCWAPGIDNISFNQLENGTYYLLELKRPSWDYDFCDKLTFQLNGIEFVTIQQEINPVNDIVIIALFAVVIIMLMSVLITLVVLRNRKNRT